MEAVELADTDFYAAVASAGIPLSPEDREVAFAEARNLHRAAALVRAYVADASPPE
jgi:hypothetical protein